MVVEPGSSGTSADSAVVAAAGGDIARAENSESESLEGDRRGRQLDMVDEGYVINAHAQVHGHADGRGDGDLDGHGDGHVHDHGHGDQMGDGVCDQIHGVLVRLPTMPYPRSCHLIGLEGGEGENQGWRGPCSELSCRFSREEEDGAEARGGAKSGFPKGDKREVEGGREEDESSRASTVEQKLMEVVEEHTGAFERYLGELKRQEDGGQVATRAPVQVRHVRQRKMWDCGVACVLMLLRTFGISLLPPPPPPPPPPEHSSEPRSSSTRPPPPPPPPPPSQNLPPIDTAVPLTIDDTELALLHALCRTTSVWTIDVAHLARAFGFEVALLTITPGANPQFTGEPYYVANFNRDVQRVNWLFRHAVCRGIRVMKRSQKSEELSRLLLYHPDCLLIVLVDKRKITHPCALQPCPPSCCGPEHGYIGHYVMLCGYDTHSDTFEMKDPAGTPVSRHITSEQLDAARTVFGTDEDVLVVSRHPLFRDLIAWHPTQRVGNP